MSKDQSTNNIHAYITATIKEAHNEERIPWHRMSTQAQSVLCVEWKSVEWFSKDMNAWVPNPVCPRQWNTEAYRVPPSVFPPQYKHNTKPATE